MFCNIFVVPLHWLLGFLFKKVQNVLFWWPSLCFIMYFVLFYCLSLSFFHAFISTFGLYYSSSVSILTEVLVYHLVLVSSVFSALFQPPASLHFVVHLLALLSLLFSSSNFFLSFVVPLDNGLTNFASWVTIPLVACWRFAQLRIILSCNHIRWMAVGWQRDRFPPVIHQDQDGQSFEQPGLVGGVHAHAGVSELDDP